MKRSSVGALAFCSLLLLTSAAVAPPSNLASLDVLVLDGQGHPVGDVPLLVEASNGESFLLVSDEAGRARAELKVRGNEPLVLAVTALGGSSADVTLRRGEGALITLTLGPCSRGYEWAIVD